MQSVTSCGVREFLLPNIFDRKKGCGRNEGWLIIRKRNHGGIEKLRLIYHTTPILLYIKGAEKICLLFVSASNERQSSRDWWPQTVHVYSQFVVT